MDKTIRLKINKEYAAAIIDILQKEDAVEILSTGGYDVPQWQQDEVNEQVVYYDKHPDKLKNWDDVAKNINPDL